MNINATRALAACFGLILLVTASVAAAQRTGNLFRGIWQGTLTPNIMLGVPEEHAERLSQPVQFELRVFNRGRAEIIFISDNDEWEVTGRDVQVQEMGSNGMIFTRMPGATDDSQNAFQFNLTKLDDETLLVDWSKISTRSNLRFDGLDELAFAGTDELRLVDD